MERRRPAERDRTPPKKEMKGNWQDETSGSWFKVTVPYGRKYDKSWLVNAIQSHCSVPFTPVDFHYVQMQAQFFVQDVHTASALRSISYKIHDEKNHKIAILVSHSVVPHSVQNKLTPQQMENLKLTMKKRYDVLEQALDLQNFRFDPDLVDNKIDMILNRRNCMAAALEVIEQQFSKLLRLNLSSNKLFQLDGLSDITWKAPNVKILNLSKNKLKSTWELNKIKELKLEELWLQGNPLCDSFSDHPSYVRMAISYSQKLKLKSLTQRNHARMAISYSQKLKLKSLTQRNHARYYCIYDSGNRQDLLNAYHDAACFSLTIPFNPEDPASSNLIKYSIKNRNMKKHEDPVLLVQLLKHTRLDIVNTLSVLPKTQHDFASFVVDVCVQTETILYFSVKGLFKEVEEMSETPVRAFTRTFIMIPTSNSSLCIVNDQLFVRDISPEETVLLPNSPFSCMPTTPLGQQKMVQMFSLQSGMNLEWSQK
ncbi:nuclear RNA export factor 2-like [Rhynchocyon petersi]